jgi:hypothetical protein
VDLRSPPDADQVIDEPVDVGERLAPYDDSALRLEPWPAKEPRAAALIDLRERGGLAHGRPLEASRRPHPAD